MHISCNTHIKMKWEQSLENRKWNLFFPVYQEIRERGQWDRQFKREGSEYRKNISPSSLFSLSCTCIVPVNMLTVWTYTQTHTLHTGGNWADTVKSKNITHIVERMATYCQQSRADQSRRLHGSSMLSQCNTEKSAYALTHTCMTTSPLFSPLQSCWPLFLFHFPSLAFPFSKQHTYAEKGRMSMTTVGGTVNLKFLLLSVLFYEHELIGYPPAAAVWLAG